MFQRDKQLKETQKQIDKQNELIQQAMRMGMDTQKVAMEANQELRSQRDQIINIVSMVREIGLDLFSAEKLANDINYRRLLNIVLLYLL